MSERMIPAAMILAKFKLQLIPILQSERRCALQNKLIRLSCLGQNRPAGQIFFGGEINHQSRAPAFGLLRTCLLEAGASIGKSDGLFLRVGSNRRAYYPT